MSAMLLPPLAALMMVVQAIMALTDGRTARERRILRSSQHANALSGSAQSELRAATRTLAFNGPGMRARRAVPWGAVRTPRVLAAPFLMLFVGVRPVIASGAGSAASARLQ